MGRRPKQTVLQRRHTGGQEAHEKMLSVTKYQRYASQNYNEVSPHISQNGHNKKDLQTINAREGMEKREPSYTADMHVSWYSYYGEQYGDPLRN